MRNFLTILWDFIKNLFHNEEVRDLLKEMLDEFIDIIIKIAREKYGKKQNTSI